MNRIIRRHTTIRQTSRHQTVLINAVIRSKQTKIVAPMNEIALKLVCARIKTSIP